ncbi:sugar porter family MFS transporter [Legionella geestiana]|uniref:sugar porter family MFS transporter n=1 Tax=Legionella geestiana TaxID=45065 RepID=UPI00109319E0|nr:sugar porter family MFS transporter [Legionella geestiana]QDQ40902.1 sugar porter family MFS transporter [Legionella geestiana]
MNGRAGNGLVWRIAAIAGLGGLLFGFDSSVVADIRDQVMAQLVLSEQQWSLVVSISLLAAIPGIPLSGLLADRLSRRMLLQLVALGFIAGSVFSALANGYFLLLAGRFITGLCIGVASYAVPLYIAEIAPANRRGGMVLLNGLAITSGQAIAYLSGFVVHDLSPHSWRWLFWASAIPGVLFFAGLLRVPHSPRWMARHHGIEAALEVLRAIRAPGHDVSHELQEIREVQTLNASGRWNRRLFSVLLTGCLLGAFQQLSGINAIMFYGPVIFQSAGFSLVREAIFATFIISLVNTLFTAFTLLTVDRLGRRRLLIGGTLAAALGLFGASYFYSLEGGLARYGVLSCLSVYVMGYCVSVGSLFWVLIAEIFPMRIRGFAMSLATVVQWATTFVIALVFMPLWSHLGAVHCLLFFGACCLIATLFIVHFIPETTGVSLEMLEKRLSRGYRIRDIGRPNGRLSTPLDAMMEDAI